ncbi:RNA-binding ATPase activator esf2 [Mycoemilia scoparia]|uniref:18S rRNA factor 2 n=1 Tax=Mycoemilia scoparia TaxID=417184 RepID=A0A9W8DSS7_9FUNG|nr:RNA-binding ATPase activator esf2 [Mycoemilia scoparia]
MPKTESKHNPEELLGFNSESEDDGSNSGSDSEVENVASSRTQAIKQQQEDDSDYDSQDDNDDDDDTNQDNGKEQDQKELKTTTKSKKKKPKKSLLTPEDVAKAQAAEKKTGILYMSRVPPFMKPQKIRHMLEKYGEIDRIYLVPEDEKAWKRRKKYGGNKKRNFVEGWIEFKNKRIAKAVAQMLNNKPMGGKKGNFYYDDLWTLKYLPKFKWHNLTDQLQFEKAVREQKLRTEMSLAKKEAEEYMVNVEKAKTIKGIESKKAAAAAASGSKRQHGDDDDDGSGDSGKKPKVQRIYKQREAVDRNSSGSAKTGKSKIDSALSSVLEQVF